MTNITDYSNKEIGTGITLQNYTVDTSTVLNIIGQGVNNYSQPLFENFMYLLSNFSGPYPAGSNFTENYQNNNNWIPDGDILSNSKTILSGQIWYQYPNFPILSQEVYTLVNSLVNMSNLTTEEITDYENKLLEIYQNITTFQNNGYLWLMNSEISNDVKPLTYNLSGYGNITVYDITSLGWTQIYPTSTSTMDEVLIENSSGGAINFYTSPNTNTITSSLNVSSGTDNVTNSGSLTINSNSVNINCPVTLTSGGKSITTPITDNSTNIATTSYVNSYYYITTVGDQGTPTETNTCTIRSGFIEYLPANHVRMNLLVQYSAENPVLIFPLTMANTTYIVNATGRDAKNNSSVSFDETLKQTTQMTFYIEYFNTSEMYNSTAGFINVVISGVKST